MMRINRSNYQNVIKNNFVRHNYLQESEIEVSRDTIKEGSPIPICFNDIKESSSIEDYKLIVYGILPCGSKVTLLIEGIYPSIDIEFDPSLDKSGNLNRIKDLLKDPVYLKKIKTQPEVHSLKLRTGKKLIGFSKDESKFIKISFKKIFHRKEFINLLKKKDIESYNNDESTYYRVAGREYKLALTGWNLISDYYSSKNKDYKSTTVLSVNIDSISKFTELSFKGISLKKEKLISLAFDIEQYSSDFDLENINRETRLPDGDIMDDTIFNIGMTFHFINEPAEFLGLSLISEECESKEGYITVICDTEKTLLLAFSYIIGKMQPDIIYEFNGSGFDWPNIYKKSKLLKITDIMLENMSMIKLSSYDLNGKDKFIYRSISIKISADMSKTMTNISLHGYVAFDLRLALMQLNPTESQSSLSFYLENYKMPGKDDMPIPTLFRYFVTKDHNGLGDVAKYCYIDCLRLHQLVYKINLIQDKKAVGSLSYTTLFDAFYRANSIKVRNLVIAHALDSNLFYNSIKKEENEEDKKEGKYPGALVLNPLTNLVKPLMSFEEYCKIKLGIADKKLIMEGLSILKSRS